MDIRKTLLAKIETYRKAADLSESAFGIAAVSDGKFVSRLRSGKGVTLTTIERAFDYMRDNPPDGGPSQPDPQPAEATA